MLRSSTAVPALLLAVAIGAAAPACASGRYYQRSSNQRDFRDVERFAYDNGYRQGFSHGERDAADRRGYRIDRDRDYRNADGGYRYGDRGDYRRFYRNGYESGYAEGYNRVARSVRNDRGSVEMRFAPNPDAHLIAESRRGRIESRIPAIDNKVLQRNVAGINLCLYIALKKNRLMSG